MKVVAILTLALASSVTLATQVDLFVTKQMIGTSDVINNKNMQWDKTSKDRIGQINLSGRS